MKAVVIFESMYGNTHAVADEVARGLTAVGDVVAGTAGDIPMSAISEADLLVVGGPTHVHGMSSKASRKAAAETADADDDLDLDESANAPALREWLKRIPAGNGRKSAAFDTRLDQPTMITGSAAKGIAKRLHRRHYTSCGEPMSFLVADSAGPLLPGELERAHKWGEGLAAVLAAGVGVSE